MRANGVREGAARPREASRFRFHNARMHIPHSFSRHLERGDVVET